MALPPLDDVCAARDLTMCVLWARCVKWMGSQHCVLSPFPQLLLSEGQLLGLGAAFLCCTWGKVGAEAGQERSPALLVLARGSPPAGGAQTMQWLLFLLQQQALRASFHLLCRRYDT